MNKQTVTTMNNLLHNTHIDLPDAQALGRQHDTFNAPKKKDLKEIKHPISVARKIMENSCHVMLVCDGAEKFALENGFKKAFKGNWGSEEHTKRPEVIQDLNRLSYNSFISHLRKLNLPLDSSAKIVGPRLLHSSQWGIIDPVDTPDGGNIGLHKHLSLGAHITNGYSCKPIIQLLRQLVFMELLTECTTEYISKCIKIFVNG